MVSQVGIGLPSETDPRDPRRGAARPSPASSTGIAESDADEVDRIDYMDAEGESYMFFALDDEWPGPYASAARGLP